MTIAEALNRYGVCEAVEGEPEVDFDRMEAIARLVASEPGISNLGISKRLEMSRTVVIRYMKRLNGAISTGGFDLSLCLEDVGEDAAVEYVGGDYNPSESLDATLRLIRGQKEKLERKQRGGKAISTAQILQLVNAEKAVLSIPQRAEDVPKDYYDQLDDRVPVPDVVCPHCGGVIPGGEDHYSETRCERDFMELGVAGDLAAEEIEDDQEKEAVDA
ncbi:winged helix-turn-helix domain-containing protein [Patescibacteria group bacterium]|nr:winged helix-turn-helix domain-containing protein [Patescibacteria group bacterium]